MRIVVVLLLLLAWYFFSWTYIDVRKSQCCTGISGDLHGTEQPIAAPAASQEMTGVGDQPDDAGSNIASPPDSQKVEDPAGRAIRFPWGSVGGAFDSAAREYLESVASTLKQTGGRIRLTGHTDNTSSAAFNQRLGMRRANAVRAYLIRIGVDPAWIEVRSMGETQPVASNETEAGRTTNRRVELEIIP
ncbi:MAG: OmpA family protein [Saprospiraceae bacterium]|nr:OmpA family protein [Saprospiraceae bacterium]